MKRIISPSTINGAIHAPSSKSMMQRCIVAALLGEGQTSIMNPSLCDDTLAALRIAEQLGAAVTLENDQVRISGGFNPREEVLHCGESGLAARMFSAVASLHHAPVTLTGLGSLKNRPFGMIEDPLSELGVECETTNGFIPVRVKGPMKGGRARVDGSTTSQFLTGLLMSLPVVNKDSELLVRNLNSKPYIDVTLKVLRDFGIEVENQVYTRFLVKGNQHYKAREYEVEGDWSGAAFLLTAGALNGKVKVTGIQKDSPQADRNIVAALERAGARVNIMNDTVEVIAADLVPFEFDATECPDLFPPLVALAAHCTGITILTGTGRLKSKESNRALVLKEIFSNLGVRIDLEKNRMIIHGGRVETGSLHASNDHRVAMAAAIAGIKAAGKVEIRGSDCVSKSYPHFFDDYIKMGGKADE
jgi:3-phosphoshikimate 1-carboxyvinyltransferase